MLGSPCETKEQSKQWTWRGESAPKKVKTVPSAGKVTASVFWDARGIIFIRYRDDQNQWVKVQITFSRTLFARFSLLRLFSLYKVEKWSGGQRFANNEEVKSAVNGYFGELVGSHYKQGIEAVKQRWKKCFHLKGD